MTLQICNRIKYPSRFALPELRLKISGKSLR